MSLAGAFSIGPGHCRAGQPPAGSYVQLQIDGLPVPNPSSACGLLGSAYTPLQQGTQGLVTGGYQLDPVPTFDRSGDSLAGAIVKPVRYLTTDLGLATTCADQQVQPTPTGACSDGRTGHGVPTLWAEPPAAGGCPARVATWCVFGDLSSLTTSWAGVPIQQLLGGPGSCVTDFGCLDQGVVSSAKVSPSPASCRPVQKAAACSLTGTFDPATGAYTLDVHAVTPLGILPIIDTHYVLTGTYRPGPPPPTTAASTPAGVGGSGGSQPAAGGTSGGHDPTAQPSGGTGAASSSSSSSAGRSPNADQPVLATDTAQLLTGTLQLAPTSCTAAGPTGSYLVVSDGTKVVVNTQSPCDHGIYTLLPPGASGLVLGQFSPDPDPTFDAHGDSLAGTIIQPVRFDGHKLGLATSATDVQDQPAGPAIYPPPQALVEGTTLLVDLRSLDVTYGGPSGGSCVRTYGRGCWEEGVRTAIGTFDPTSDNWTLNWQAEQAFTGDSAGITFHLEGHFTGHASIAPVGSGDGWLPARYTVVGGSTETSGPGGAGTGGAGSAGVGTGVKGSHDEKLAAAPGSSLSSASGSSASGSRRGGSGPVRGGGGVPMIAGVHLPFGRAWPQWTALLMGLVIVVSLGGLVVVAVRRGLLRS